MELADILNFKGFSFLYTHCAECIKKLDPFKFKLAITYGLNLTAMTASNFKV